MTTTRNISAGERWARRSDEQRAWVKERLAAVDPHRLNAWTDALDDAIAVLDEADKRAAIWYEIDSIAEMLVGIAKRATAEPEAKDGESRWILLQERVWTASDARIRRA